MFILSRESKPIPVPRSVTLCDGTWVVFLHLCNRLLGSDLYKKVGLECAHPPGARLSTCAELDPHLDATQYNETANEFDIRDRSQFEAVRRRFPLRLS